MSDGSSLGLNAHEALGAIFRSDDEEVELPEDRSPEAVKARVLCAPEPLDGKPIWKRVEDGEIEEGEGYALVADAIARAFLIVLLDEPDLLTHELVYTEEDLRHQDEVVRESMLGKPRAACDALWEKATERWPEFDEWLGGPSGFQVGFAYNTVRHIHGESETGNPAIITISS